jgi:hypothetical protein
MNSTQDAEEFVRQWLTMLDTKAPVEAFLKYLPDGDFEQWSYPEIEIKNVEHLKAFFAQAWGMIKQQTNAVTRLNANAVAGGRFQVEADAQWSATTVQGQSLSRALHYSLTVGPGASTHDPSGVYPKVYRYKMTRP